MGIRAVRCTVIERLSVPPGGELSVRKALIDLSRIDEGVRLIATNSDDWFVETGLDKELVDASPMVPVQNPYSWSRLVHLLGRITGNRAGANLVLMAADFGRAYFTERRDSSLKL